MANIWGNKNLHYYLLVWERKTLEDYIEMSHTEGRRREQDKLVDGLRMRTFTIQLFVYWKVFLHMGKCIANSKEHITKIEV